MTASWSATRGVGVKVVGDGKTMAAGADAVGAEGDAVGVGAIPARADGERQQANDQETQQSRDPNDAT